MKKQAMMIIFTIEVFTHGKRSSFYIQPSSEQCYIFELYSILK